MKASWLGWSLFSLWAVPTLAMRFRGTDPDTPTTFNGVEVPPLPQLTPEMFEEVTKDGYWLVKHYSPSCPHCRKAAPVYQTLYEYYYTSDPLSPNSEDSPDPKSPNTFTKYYNFHFASMNCLAHGDFCEKLGIDFYPVWGFYDNGTPKESHVGHKPPEELSKLIEEKLEAIKPGSRPEGGPKLPEVGAISMKPVPEEPEDDDEDEDEDEDDDDFSNLWPDLDDDDDLDDDLDDRYSRKSSSRNEKSELKRGDRERDSEKKSGSKKTGSERDSETKRGSKKRGSKKTDSEKDSEKKGGSRKADAEKDGEKKGGSKKAGTEKNGVKKADSETGDTKKTGRAKDDSENADVENSDTKDDIENDDKFGSAKPEGVSRKSNTKPKDEGPPPNPQGISVPLTAESFQKLVTTTQDPWFIKFFVPWCPHCQDLAPNWLEMAKEMKNTLNVGEVDCDVEERLCGEADVEGFPTIHFFRGGERVEYTGLRGLGDLLAYSKKAVGPHSEIQEVDTAAFKELEETEEVLFLYFYDHATTSEDFKAIERLTLSLVGHARIVKTRSAALAERFKISTWPRLLVVRDGRPNYYNALAPKDMRDVRQLLSWMQTVWLPIVPELTASNAREIMDGKFVVLGILSRRRSDDFKQSRRELKEAALEWMDKQVQLFRLERSELRDAKQLRIEEADDRNDQRALRAAKNTRITIREDDKKAVTFAWVDGDFWERWLRTTYGIDVENGDRVIINDEDNRRYWDTASSGAPIIASRTSILETIPLVVSSPTKLSPKSTIGAFESVIFLTRTFLTGHPILSLVFLVLSVAGVTIYRSRSLRRGGTSRGGILGNTSPSGGLFALDNKQSFLNGGSTGKVD